MYVFLMWYVRWFSSQSLMYLVYIINGWFSFLSFDLRWGFPSTIRNSYKYLRSIQ
jgi:hypothetical protein